MKSWLLSYLLVFILPCTQVISSEISTEQAAAPLKKARYRQYMLPHDHSLRPILRRIFYNERVLKNEACFEAAGFTTLYMSRKFNMRMARHPEVPGYLFKVYLTSEHNDRSKIMQRLVQRCMSAAIIRQVIEMHKIRHFTVADKWLYRIDRLKTTQTPLLVLVVKDMKIAERNITKTAWMTKITRPHLQELYLILKEGYGSISATLNIPYVKDGTFTFIDTEYPQRKFKLHNMNRFLSQEMQQEWERILQENHYE